MAENTRYIAIGDIHGCLQSTNALLEKLEAHAADATFVFLGDYIDRGPDSKGVVDCLLAFRETHDCVFLKGNHEEMLLDAIKDVKKDFWLKNGGKATLKSYGSNADPITLPDHHLTFYNNTEIYFETEDYFFVHAGMDPTKTIQENLADDALVEQFLWERSHLNSFDNPWEKTVVFGHTPRPHPIRKPNMIGIDTGCVYDSLGYGKLTAVLLPENEFIKQVSLDS